MVMATTVAEYKIRKCLAKLERQGDIALECFAFEMIGPREAELRDGNGDAFRLAYDPVSESVSEI